MYAGLEEAWNRGRPGTTDLIHSSIHELQASAVCRHESFKLLTFKLEELFCDAILLIHGIF